MANYENQHFVPVFYTKRWADESKKVVRHFFDENIRNRDNFQCKPAGFTTIGCESNLWTFRGAKDKRFKYSIEAELFGQIDNAAARIAQKIVNNEKRLSNEELIDWAKFLNSLRFRNPLTIRYGIRPVAGDVKIGSEAEAPPWPEPNEPFQDAFVEPLMLLGQILKRSNLEQFVEKTCFAARILKNSPFKLLTCDLPLLKFRSRINRLEPVWLLPLSPSVLFIAAQYAVDHEFWRELPERVLAMNVNHAVTKSYMREVWAIDQSQSDYIEKRMRLRGAIPLDELVRQMVNDR